LKSSGEVSVDSIKETLFKLKIRQEELDGEARHYRDDIITKEKMLKKMEDKKGSIKQKIEIENANKENEIHALRLQL
jgi:acid stress-induced BolA-like protein IbaG/YrbA